jgi:hypothetical protein
MCSRTSVDGQTGEYLYGPRARGTRDKPDICRRNGAGRRMSRTRPYRASWVQTVEAAQKLGKPVGRYVTLEAPLACAARYGVFRKVAETLYGRAGASAAEGGRRDGYTGGGAGKPLHHAGFAGPARSGEDVCDTAISRSTCGYHRRAHAVRGGYRAGGTGPRAWKRWKCCAGW